MTTGTSTSEPRRPAGLLAPVRVAAALLLVAASMSCGQLQRQGEGSSYLIVNALDAAPGSDPATFGGGILLSDVVTSKGIFNDLGRIRFQLALKDPGGSGSPTAPTTANYITVNQYHVQYIRSDGRNAQGVDVPYSFDGGMTLTVGAGEVSGIFNIVRDIAKVEAPLKALGVNFLVISTIAEVTFYGHDQTGRQVSATARISIDFADFADKTS